jgi:MFS family permease
VVVAAGVAAALHVGKLPVALPVLREALGIDVVEAGFLLSLVQGAGMVAGLAVGLAADAVGLRRCMSIGLAVLGLSGLGGAFADGSHAVGWLLASRAAEGIGLLLTALPAPALIRRLRAGRTADAALGLWGAYMPVGVACALLAGPWLIVVAGWRGWWVAVALASLGIAAWLVVACPPTRDGRPPKRRARPRTRARPRGAAWRSTAWRAPSPRRARGCSRCPSPCTRASGSP